METNEDIVIVGGGIAGLSLASALHKVGLKALVLESYDTLRATGAAFTTWTNAWKCLDVLGVGDSLRRQHSRLSRIIVTSIETGLQTAELPYGNHEVRCVKRKVLLETLAKELPPNTIRFSSKVTNIEKSGYFNLLHLADGSILKTKVLIGCDGVNSIVAKYLGFKKPSFVNRLAIRGYIDFKENHGFEPDFLQFAGRGKRYGILPCDATSVYWFFTWSPQNEDEEEMKENPAKLKQFVMSNLGNVQQKIKSIIQNTKPENIICSQLRLRNPLEIMSHNITTNNTVISGDALHPMTPDLGQGACSALEDGIALARCLSERFSKESDSEELEYKKIETCLRKYAKERKWRSIDLITTGYFVGVVQQSGWKFVGFLRDKLFAGFLAGLLLKKAEYDCGKLMDTEFR